VGAAQARAATAAHVAADAGTGGAGGRPYATGCFAILAIMANGVFQEEAIFAPLALGIVMGLAGLLLGRACSVETLALGAITAPERTGRLPRRTPRPA